MITEKDYNPEFCRYVLNCSNCEGSPKCFKDGGNIAEGLGSEHKAIKCKNYCSKFYGSTKPIRETKEFIENYNRKFIRQTN